ncbi:proline-rich protein 22-like [Grus japonensis]|uniref:Proline-rich protein 22-like n=1 Tax=Grus japonensis TaxID=30415 RepID=A0ABC9YFE3_GRUJA
MQDLMLEQGEAPEGGCGPVGSPRWSKLLAGAVDQWREEPTPEQELLTLPKELLTPDYSIPETTDAMLILGEFFTIGMQPQEPWGAAGMALPPSQAAACEKRGKKRGQSALPKPDSKRRALAGSTRVAGGEVEPEQG